MSTPSCYVIQAAEWSSVVRTIFWLVLFAAAGGFFASCRFIDYFGLLVRQVRRWRKRRAGGRS